MGGREMPGPDISVDARGCRVVRTGAPNLYLFAECFNVSTKAKRAN